MKWTFDIQMLYLMSIQQH